MKGQVCTIVTPSLGFDTLPEVSKPSCTPPFRLCLRGKRAKPSILAETVSTVPPLALPAHFVTSVATSITPVLVDNRASIAASTGCTPTTTTTTKAKVVNSMSDTALAPIVNFVTSIASTRAPVLPKVEASTTVTSSITTTTIATTSATATTKTVAASEPDPIAIRISSLGDVVKNHSCDTISEFSDTTEAPYTITEPSHTAKRRLKFSDHAIQESSKHSLFAYDNDGPKSLPDKQLKYAQQNLTGPSVFDRVVNFQNLLTLHSKGLSHHQPYSKSKQHLNKNSPNLQPINSHRATRDFISENNTISGFKHCNETYRQSYAANEGSIHSNKTYMNGYQEETVSRESLTPSLQVKKDDRSKTISSSQSSQLHLPEKWIIKRNFQSPFLLGSGYGEKHNLWTRNNLLDLCQNKTSIQSCVSSCSYSKGDLNRQFYEKEENFLIRDKLLSQDKISLLDGHPPNCFKEEVRHLCSEKDKTKSSLTQSSGETLETHIPCSEKNARKLVSSGLKRLVSQNQDSQSSSLTSTSTTSSPVWLARSLRQLHKIRHDEFREKRFLGNNLTFQEFNPNQPTSRKLVYTKGHGINSYNEYKRQTPLCPISSGISQDGLSLHSQPNSRENLKVMSLSRSPYNSTTIPWSLNSAQVLGKAIENESKLSSSSSSSSSNTLSKSERSTHPAIDIQTNNPCSSTSITGTAFKPKHKEERFDIPTALSNAKGKTRSKVMVESGLLPQDIDTYKQCHEMIDYFWSYQGMGRQVLGLQSPSFSLQSSMWEKEKMGADKTDTRLLRDQYKDLQHKSVFSKFSRVPPILVTDFDDPSDTSDKCSDKVGPELMQNAANGRQSQRRNKRGRKRRNQRQKNKGVTTRDISTHDEENSFEPKEKAKDKLRLVVTLPLLTKSVDEE